MVHMDLGQGGSVRYVSWHDIPLYIRLQRHLSCHNAPGLLTPGVLFGYLLVLASVTRRHVFFHNESTHLQ